MVTGTKKRNFEKDTIEKKVRVELPPPSLKRPYKIIAAMPCFNTEVFIADVVSKARQYVDQVIVVDDGSCDGTAERAGSAGAKVLSHSTNRGYGEAIKSCFEVAKQNDADILVILDGDGQHNPDEIPHLLTPALREKADLIIGSRFLTNGHKVHWYRRFGIEVITFLWNLGSKTKVSDSQSGYRVYKKDLFQSFSLAESGMGISIETLEKARRRGASIIEVPISCQYSSSAPSLKAIKHGLGVAISVLRLRLTNSLSRKTQ